VKTATEVLGQFFAAINRNDMAAISNDFDPQIVRIEPEGFPTAGTYRGIARSWNISLSVSGRRPSSGPASRIERRFASDIGIQADVGGAGQPSILVGIKRAARNHVHQRGHRQSDQHGNVGAA